MTVKATCPRCNSKSIHQSHDTTACMACGHVVNEPAPPPSTLGALLAAEGTPKPGDISDRWRR